MPKESKPDQPLCSGCTRYENGACQFFQIHLEAEPQSVISACTHYTPPPKAEETKS